MRLITHDCYSRVVFLWPSPANLYHYFFFFFYFVLHACTALMLHVEGASRYTRWNARSNWNFNLICFASVKRGIFIIVVNVKEYRYIVFNHEWWSMVNIVENYKAGTKRKKKRYHLISSQNVVSFLFISHVRFRRSRSRDGRYLSLHGKRASRSLYFCTNIYLRFRPLENRFFLRGKYWHSV